MSDKNGNAIKGRLRSLINFQRSMSSGYARESIMSTWEWISIKNQSRSPPQIGGPLQVAIGLNKVEDEQKERSWVRLSVSAVQRRKVTS